MTTADGGKGVVEMPLATEIAYGLRTDPRAVDDCVPHDVNEAIWAFEGAARVRAIAETQEYPADRPEGFATGYCRRMNEITADYIDRTRKALRVTIAAAIKRGEWHDDSG